MPGCQRRAESQPALSDGSATSSPSRRISRLGADAAGTKWSSTAAALRPANWPRIEPLARRTCGRSTSNTRPARPASQGAPRSATATCCSTRYYVGDCQRFTDERPHLHSGAVLSLLWLRAGHAGLRRAWHGDGHPGRYLQAAPPRSTRSKESAHGPLRRADDVHRPVARSVVFRPRSVVAAHRHHVGQPVSDRGHAASDSTASAPERDHDRLRPDRSLAGHHANADRRPTRAARRDRRPSRCPAWK